MTFNFVCMITKLLQPTQVLSKKFFELMDNVNMMKRNKMLNTTRNLEK